MRASAERPRSPLAVVLALVLVNGAVTFHNVWPTLGIRWPGELSIELAVLLLCSIVEWVYRPDASPTHRRARCGTRASCDRAIRRGHRARLWRGREINLYWDAQHVGALAGMLIAVAPVWAVAGGALALVAVLTVLYLGARWSLRTIDDALRARRAQLGFGCGVRRTHRLVRRAEGRRARPAPTPVFHSRESNLRDSDRASLLDTFANSKARSAACPPHHRCSRISARSSVATSSSCSWSRTAEHLRPTPKSRAW